MPRVKCFDILENDLELKEMFNSITDNMPESEQRALGIKLAKAEMVNIKSVVDGMWRKSKGKGDHEGAIKARVEGIEKDYNGRIEGLREKIKGNEKANEVTLSETSTLSENAKSENAKSEKGKVEPTQAETTSGNNVTQTEPTPAASTNGNETTSGKQSAGKENKNEVTLSENKAQTPEQVNKTKRLVRNEKAKKEIDKAWDDFFKPNGNLTMGGLDPQKIEAGTKLVGLYIKHGVYKFKDIAEDAYSKFGNKLRDIFTELKAVYSAYYNSTTDEIAAKMDESVRSITFDDIEFSANKKANPKDNFISEISNKLFNGEKLNIVSIRKIANEQGLTNIGDTELQEYVELAIISNAKEIVKQDISQDEKYSKIVDLYNLQPTISMRSSERIDKQQYSTPIPMSFVAGEYVNHIAPQRILEPSAGNGMMVFNVNSGNVIANEIDQIRVENLQNQGFNSVTQHDGTKPFNIEKVDAIITNPPFGSSPAKEYGDGYKIAGLDEQMVINALDRLKDNGRAAIIIGGHTKYNKNGTLAGEKAFLNYLYNYYNVADIINMDGSLYQKQGTTFPTRMILINGRRINTETRLFAPLQDKANAEIVKTFNELNERIKSIKNEHISSAELSVGSNDNGEKQAKGNEQGLNKSGDKTIDIGSEATKRKPNRPSERPIANTNSNNGTGTVGSDNGIRPNSESNTGVERQENGDTSTETDGGIQQQNPIQLSNRVEHPNRTIDHKAEKTEYIPQSKSGKIGSVVPTNMVLPLTNVLSQFGDIDNYVQNKLGYKSKEELFNALSAEQIDSVALAIYQIENGNALIIGDQTGVGKGRQAAAIIRYAVLQGQKPIFITEKPHLFSDIYRDLKAIGSEGLSPFIVNDKSATSDPTMTDEDGAIIYKPLSSTLKKPIFENGIIPNNYDYVVTTYSQLSSSKDKPSIKKDFFANISMGNILIMDESHNAGGNGNTGAYLQEVLPNTKGVTFLSGTFAKRPDNMPIYSTKTAMRDTNMSNEELIEAIKKGGVPLQEVLSKNLVDVGQMIRRERDFTGVTIDWEILDDSKDEHTKVFDNVIEVFNELIHFQRDFINPIIDGINDDIKGEQGSVGNTTGTADLGVSNPPFASKTFNLVRQLLLSLKAEDIARETIQELKNGRKPVIGISNTMEAFLNDMNIQDGDILSNIDYSLTLKKGLDGLFRYTEKDYRGESTNKKLSVNDLSEEGRARYYEISEKIKKTSSGITISPIDVIKNRVREAGYTIGELTGRKNELLLNGDKSATVSKRKDTDKKKLARDFNSGALDVLIINQSGSTGISLHAAENFKDKRQRVMLSAQTQLDVNTEIQLRGRIDRTGQKIRGAYRYIISPIPAEQRLIMMFKAKLKSLDANTTSSQKSKTNEINVVDFLNKYGDELVVDYLKENRSINEMLLDPFKFEDKSDEEVDSYTAEEGASNKVSGRVALLSVKEQEKFYKEITERYQSLINYLNDNNANDLEIKTLPLNTVTKLMTVVVKGIDNGNPFSEDSVMETVEMDVLKKPMTSAEIKEEIHKLSNGLTNQEYRNENSSKLKEYTESKIATDIEDIKESYKPKEKRAINNATKYALKNNLPVDQEVSRALDALNTAMQNRIDAHESKNRTVFYGISNILDYMTLGKSYLIPNSIDIGENTAYTRGIFMGFKMKQKLNPSSITAVFATLDGRRKVEIPLSKVNYLNAIISQSNYVRDNTNLDTWDSQTIKSNRRTGYIITGNILQAFAVNNGGQLVTYTTQDGGLKQGILLPESFKVTEQKMRVQIIAGLDILKNGIILLDTTKEISISRSRDGGYTLEVPLSKAKGGKYFLDTKLRDLIIGRNFTQRGGRMIADITDNRISDVLQYLTTKYNTSIEVDATKKGLDKTGNGNINLRAGVTITTKDDIDQSKDKTKATKEKIQAAYPDVEVVQSESDLPQTVVNYINDTDSKGTVKGVEYNGKIFLVADNIATMGEAENTYRHEVLGHKNVNEYLKDNLDKFTEKLVDNASVYQKKQLQLIANEYLGGKDISTLSKKEKQLLGREYIARIAEGKIKNIGVWEKVKDFFKRMLRSLGIKLNITDREIEGLINRAEKKANKQAVKGDPNLSISNDSGVANDVTLSENAESTNGREGEESSNQKMPVTINEIVDKLYNPKENIDEKIGARYEKYQTGSQRLKSLLGTLAEVALAKNKKEKWGILAGKGSITNLNASLKSLLFDINKLSKSNWDMSQIEDIAKKYEDANGDYLHTQTEPTTSGNINLSKNSPFTNIALELNKAFPKATYMDRVVAAAEKAYNENNSVAEAVKAGLATMRKEKDYITLSGAVKSDMDNQVRDIIKTIPANKKVELNYQALNNDQKAAINEHAYELIMSKDFKDKAEFSLRVEELYGLNPTDAGKIYDSIMEGINKQTEDIFDIELRNSGEIMGHMNNPTISKVSEGEINNVNYLANSFAEMNEDIDSIFDKIRKANPKNWEKIIADKILAKMEKKDIQAAIFADRFVTYINNYLVNNINDADYMAKALEYKGYRVNILRKRQKFTQEYATYFAALQQLKLNNPLTLLTEQGLLSEEEKNKAKKVTKTVQQRPTVAPSPMPTAPTTQGSQTTGSQTTSGNQNPQKPSSNSKAKVKSNILDALKGAVDNVKNIIEKIKKTPC